MKMMAGQVPHHQHNGHRGAAERTAASGTRRRPGTGLLDDEPLVPVHKKAKLAKPVKRERSAAATVEPVVCGH